VTEPGGVLSARNDGLTEQDGISPHARTAGMVSPDPQFAGVHEARAVGAKGAEDRPRPG
jgi:hypothetical protein